MMNITGYNNNLLFPHTIDEKNVESFLKAVYKVFSYNNKFVPNVLLDLSKTRKSNILGDLLIYKIIDYAFMNRCFLDPSIKGNQEIEREWNSTGFKALIFEYVRNKEAYFNNLEFKKINDLFIAPIILKQDRWSKKTNKAVLKVCEYYKYNPDILMAITSCIGEVSSNFRSHAVNDTQSVLVASGNKEYFEIACADTGNGVYSTLSPEIAEKSKQKVLQKSLNKGVTSKRDSDHSGMGLWLIGLLVKCQKGELYLYSQGAFVKIEKGRMRSGVCANWQGTIIYVKIPLIETEGIEEYKRQRSLNQRPIKLNKI